MSSKRQNLTCGLAAPSSLCQSLESWAVDTVYLLKGHQEVPWEGAVHYSFLYCSCRGTLAPKVLSPLGPNPRGLVARSSPPPSGLQSHLHSRPLSTVEGLVCCCCSWWQCSPPRVWRSCAEMSVQPEPVGAWGNIRGWRSGSCFVSTSVFCKSGGQQDTAAIQVPFVCALCFGFCGLEGRLLAASCLHPNPLPGPACGC